MKIMPLKLTPSRVATGLATASKIKASKANFNNDFRPETNNDLAAQLVTQAVASAMKKADIRIASSVLLFLTSEFANNPQSAIKAAAKTANCTQIIGCSATGIFTDEDWVLDSPAAAAMVFSGDISLESVREHVDNQLLLTLTAPNAINTTWLNNKGTRFGGVSGDAIGHGPFSVWANGKDTVQGHCEITLKHTRGAVAATHGLRFLSTPQRITACEGHDICKLGNTSAMDSLQTAWESVNDSTENLPYHQLMAVYLDEYVQDGNQIENGNYSLATLIGGNEAKQSITLAKCLQKNQWLCWAIRDIEAAEANFKKTALKLGKQLGEQLSEELGDTAPDFGLLFSCLGRGPYLYGIQDKDLLSLNTLYPNMPFIGFYGNGEIAPINGKNELLQYSAVLGLFKAD